MEWSNVSVKINQLKPWDINPRTSTKAQAKRLINSWQEFGQVETIAIGPDNEVYDGHQRLSALRAVYGDNYELQARKSERVLTEEERKRLVLLLHTGAVGEWDWDILSGWSPDTLTGAGFDIDLLKEWKRDISALENFLASEHEQELEDKEPEFDAAEELREKWGVETGQLWKLGEHKLLCGNSAKIQDVNRLLEDELPDLLFTSPPYGQQRDYTEEYSEDKKDWQGMMFGVFDLVQLAEGGQILVNLGLIHHENEWVPYWDPWIERMRENGWRRYGLYVWDQGFGLLGDWHGRLAPSFELVFHFNKSAKHPNKIVEKKEESITIKKAAKGGLRGADGIVTNLSSPAKSLQSHKIPDSVIRITRSMEAIRTLHPAVFSLEFAKFNVETWTAENDIVFEPFSGSGTVIMACEMLSRKCRAIDISPSYVAVALERWNAATGRMPEKIS